MLIIIFASWPGFSALTLLVGRQTRRTSGLLKVAECWFVGGDDLLEFLEFQLAPPPPPSCFDIPVPTYPDRPFKTCVVAVVVLASCGIVLRMTWAARSVPKGCAI